MSVGRQYGGSLDAYDRARPDYPARIWDILVDRCGLGPGTATFEIGAGNGLATRHLLQLGADLVAVEPDRRFAAHLESAKVHWSSFEESDLAGGHFDLGFAGNSFHWVSRPAGIEKVARLLKVGGWWAAAWSIHGGPGYSDPLADVLGPVVGDPGEGSSPFSLDARSRMAELLAVGFADLGVEAWTWTWEWDTQAARSLYSTFGRIMGLEPEPRRRLLDDIEMAVEARGGRLERLMTTVLYTGRKRS